MPIERVSRGFKDLSMTFKSNPLNDDLIGLKNENAIARSIRNIVMTVRGEKFFDENCFPFRLIILFIILNFVFCNMINYILKFAINTFNYVL